jgi:serine/threonine protein kinase
MTAGSRPKTLSLAFADGGEKGKVVMVRSALKAGRYAIDRVFAYGGMGIIFRGRDTRLCDNDVLIKAVKYQASEFALDKQKALYNVYQLRQMLKRERRILCELRQRGINNVPQPSDFFYDENPELSQKKYPFGTLDASEEHRFLKLKIEVNQEPYLVMERIVGTPLASRIDTMSPRTVLTVVRDVLVLLGKMHAPRRRDDGSTLELVYLDLKPENILVDAGNRMTLIDFGGVMPKVDGTYSKEQRGALTHGYAAPELGTMFSSQTDVDGRADVYSAGAVLWRAFSGRDPTRLACPTRDPFPVLDPSALPAELAALVKDIVVRALQRDPNDRFASAELMAEAIDQALTTLGEGWSSR